MYELLPWQSDVLTDYSVKHSSDYVLVAGTGCGKTPVGMSMAAHTFNKLPADEAIILAVAPLREIKRSWKAAAKKLGINVAIKPQELAADTDMYVSTYAGAATAIKDINDFNGRKLIIIFDEFHHLEENNTWASSFLDMSPDNYVKRIFLSGTPWNEQGDISESMVQYDNGVVKADKTYTYGQNVNELDSARNTVMVHFDRFRVTRTIYYKDKVTGEQSERLVDTQKACESDSLGDFVSVDSYHEFSANTGLTSLLSAAVAKLNDVRKGVSNAGGVVFVTDRYAADIVQQYMRDDLGVDALIISSDDPKSHDKIKRIRYSYDQWIIAIDMVAEGVDITRLKVIADLTNRKTMMHIIQRWGRVLRRIRDEQGGLSEWESDAYIFYVAHPMLDKVARHIEEDLRKHKKKKIGGEPPPEQRKIKTGSEGNGERQAALFRGKRPDAVVDVLAQWMLSNNYSGIREAKYNLMQAMSLAKILIDSSAIPSEFSMPEVVKDEPKNIDMSADFIPAATKDEATKRTTKIKGRLAHSVFDGDYAAATREISARYGVHTFTCEHKTLDELNAYLKCAKETLDAY